LLFPDSKYFWVKASKLYWNDFGAEGKDIYQLTDAISLLMKVVQGLFELYLLNFQVAFGS
jgi:hypothetical protein